jgi:hypothetical protein
VLVPNADQRNGAAAVRFGSGPILRIALSALAAALNRLADFLESGKKLPVDITGVVKSQ